MATTAIVKYVNTVDSKLPEIAIENGQLIFVSDTREIHLDFNGVRTVYRQFIPLRKESDRVNYLAPIRAFYFVDETKVFWQFDDNGEWIQLTSPPKEQITFINYADLPIIGQEKMLYITETQSYTWNGSEYVRLGAYVWEEF